MEKQGYIWGTGRRKSAVARVRLRSGSGEFLVNDRPMDRYFLTEHWRRPVREVLQVTASEKQVDVIVRVSGGGPSGQAGAVRLGIARALVRWNPTLEDKLREEGMLTRDPRMKERKKYGRRGARRGFQFSKR